MTEKLLRQKKKNASKLGKCEGAKRTNALEFLSKDQANPLVLETERLGVESLGESDLYWRWIRRGKNTPEKGISLPGKGEKDAL